MDQQQATAPTSSSSVAPPSSRVSRSASVATNSNLGGANNNNTTRRKPLTRRALSTMSEDEKAQVLQQLQIEDEERAKSLNHQSANRPSRKNNNNNNNNKKSTSSSTQSDARRKENRISGRIRGRDDEEGDDHQNVDDDVKKIENATIDEIQALLPIDVRRRYIDSSLLSTKGVLPRYTTNTHSSSSSSTTTASSSSNNTNNTLKGSAIPSSHLKALCMRAMAVVPPTKKVADDGKDKTSTITNNNGEEDLNGDARRKAWADICQMHKNEANREQEKKKKIFERSSEENHCRHESGKERVESNVNNFATMELFRCLMAVPR